MVLLVVIKSNRDNGFIKKMIVGDVDNYDKDNHAMAVVVNIGNERWQR
jgi:hypothetical protein